VLAVGLSGQALTQWVAEINRHELFLV